MRGDGDGWAECGLGHRHWGRHSAAGLLASNEDAGGVQWVLLQRRAAWSHHGDTWGLPGGASDSDETPEQTALREAAEEADLDPSSLRVFGHLDDQHGGWGYTTVLAAAPSLLPVTPQLESAELRWVDAREVERLPLHPGFGATWPALRDHLRPPRLVVDVANVMGSRPDGWWRDRAGAAARLIDQVTALAAEGVPGDALPRGAGKGGLTVYYPEVVLVVEGAARAAAERPSPHPSVRVVAAGGHGDDEIVAQAAAPGAIVLAVTADRVLRERLTAAGAAVTGPGWLLQLLG